MWISLLAFVLMTVGSKFLNMSDDSGSIFFLYYSVIILLTIRILIRILKKNDIFPSVPFDMVSLILISIVSLSYFMNVAIFKSAADVWGGYNLRGFAALSVICYWLVYYLIAAEGSRGKRFEILFKVFNLTLILGTILYIINFSATVDEIADIALLLGPGALLLIMQSKSIFIRFIASVNLIITVIFAFNASIGALAGILFVLFLMLLLEIYKNKSNIKNRKVMTRLVIYIIVIVAVFCLVWVNPTRTSIANIINLSAKSVFLNPTWQGVIFGHDLIPVGTTLFDAIYDFGILPTIAAAALFVFICKTLLRSRKVEGIYLLTLIIAIVVYSALTEVADNVLILLWVVIAISSALIKTDSAKKPNKEELVINNLQGIKNKDVHRVSIWIQRLLLLAVVVASIALITQVWSLAMYIT